MSLQENENNIKKLSPSQITDNKSQILHDIKPNTSISINNNLIHLKNEVSDNNFSNEVDSKINLNGGQQHVDMHHKVVIKDNLMNNVKSPRDLQICNNTLLCIPPREQKLPCDCMECFPSLSHLPIKRIKSKSSNIQNDNNPISMHKPILETFKNEEPIAGPSGLNLRNKNPPSSSICISRIAADSSDSEEETVTYVPKYRKALSSLASTSKCDIK